MKKIRFAFASALTMALLAGCSTFPSDAMSLDATTLPYPVMLSKVSKTANLSTRDLTTTYTKVSFTTSYSDGKGGTVSNSTSNANLDRNPIGTQIADLFIVQQPEWVSLSSFTLTNKRLEIAVIGAYDSVTYSFGSKMGFPSFGGAK